MSTSVTPRHVEALATMVETAAADDIDVHVALVAQGVSRIVIRGRVIRGRTKAEQVATTLGFVPVVGTPGLWRGVLDGVDCIVGAQR